MHGRGEGGVGHIMKERCEERRDAIYEERSRCSELFPFLADRTLYRRSVSFIVVSMSIVLSCRDCLCVYSNIGESHLLHSFHLHRAIKYQYLSPFIWHSDSKRNLHILCIQFKSNSKHSVPWCLDGSMCCACAVAFAFAFEIYLACVHIHLDYIILINL